jgi:dephospho-CoA kinase
MGEENNLYQTLVQSPKFKQAFQTVTVYGVAGTNGSGKDTALQVLMEHGFFVFNTGDALRQITKAVMGTTQRGGNTSPTGTIANWQRTTYPGGMVTLGFIDYWARILHMPPELHPKGLAIGSIRSVSEAQALKDFGGQLIVVDADDHVRYERIIGRGRTYEQSITFEQFQTEEAAEMGYDETDPTKFGMAQVIDMADITLKNDFEDIETFSNTVRETLKLSENG